MRNIFMISLMLLLFASCNDEPAMPEKDVPVKGYKPVYLSETNYTDIYATEPVTLVNPGKIYLYQNFVFINEIRKGIHVINNSDPMNPVKVKFINIPGNVDIAIKQGVLYADNYTDLIAIDISDLNNIKVLKRIKDITPKANQMYPEAQSFSYFECVDTTKGLVVDWVETDLINPKCYVQW